MKTRDYAQIAYLGRFLSTQEVATSLRLSTSAASRLLRKLAEDGLAQRVRSGLWSIGPEPPGMYEVVDVLTRPYPAYVSLRSALQFHGSIDQIPRERSIVSLDRAKVIVTSLGTYRVHRVPPELFGGWEMRTDRSGRSFKMASPAKALFDIAYLGAATTGRPRRVPELEIGDDPRPDWERWLARIRSPRLRTLTGRGLEHLLTRAVR